MPGQTALHLASPLICCKLIENSRRDVLSAVHVEMNCSRASRASAQTATLVIAHTYEKYPLREKPLTRTIATVKISSKGIEPVSLTRKPEEGAAETGMSAGLLSLLTRFARLRDEGPTHAQASRVSTLRLGISASCQRQAASR